MASYYDKEGKEHKYLGPFSTIIIMGMVGTGLIVASGMQYYDATMRISIAAAFTGMLALIPFVYLPD